MNKQNLVVGLGEIGKPIFQLLSKNTPTTGYDLNSKLMSKPIDIKNCHISFLHICIPFSNKFEFNIISFSKKFKPEIIVIHSTISPYTTKKLQAKLSIPVIYSATRGVHKRMLQDLKRYTKFFAVSKDIPHNKMAAQEFVKLMQKCGVKTQQISNPLTLELAKIVVDTSYYGWLINYAQLSNMIAKKHNVDYDEMWSFADEIHKFLGNRPKMFPGFIGGHCVIPNLSLINEASLWQIDKINNIYSKKVKDAKSINKKYDKSKKASYDI
jgi:UDP-N-acetyl-D-mannosaminuronate dehydrogenase